MSSASNGKIDGEGYVSKNNFKEYAREFALNPTVDCLLSPGSPD